MLQVGINQWETLPIKVNFLVFLTKTFRIQIIPHYNYRVYKQKIKSNLILLSNINILYITRILFTKLLKKDLLNVLCTKVVI